MKKSVRIAVAAAALAVVAATLEPPPAAAEVYCADYVFCAVSPSEAGALS